jgi:PIF1-like helicase
MTCDDLSAFQPLRCTITGQAGTGKSVLLNTITSCIRTVFEYNNVVAVGCPTGTAAFNANGDTMHNLTEQGISGDYKPFTLSDAKKKRLCRKFRHLLCLMIDERSLLTSKLLGNSAQVLSETVYDGCNILDEFGGIPVVILAGDDHQLPGMSEGGIEALTRYGGTKMTQKGREIFRQCSGTVFELSTIRRVSDSKQKDKDLIQRIRTGTGVTDEDVAKLQSLHLDNIREKHGSEVVKQIEADAVYLFWTNEKKTKHNLHRLGEMNTPDNPTAIIRPSGFGNKFGKSINSHFEDDTPKAALLCVGAKVCLQGQNFHPQWGLHNGACGTVKEIVFNDGKNPNNGDHPSYVIVNFPQYKGPPWDKENTQVRHCCSIVYYRIILKNCIHIHKDIPIPMIHKQCKFQCCKRTFLPLELAFARTLHRFQGLSAGPVDEGKIPNMFGVIVCDPDIRAVEGRATGFFYTMLSRATTLGDENGLNSAIYFTGPHLTKERIQNLTLKTNSNQTLQNVKRRTEWVHHLKNNTRDTTQADEDRMKTVFKWAKQPISYDALFARTNQYIRLSPKRNQPKHKNKKHA